MDVKVDYLTKLQGKKRAAHLSILVLYVALLCAAVSIMRGKEPRSPLQGARVGRRIFTVMALAETVVVCLAPLCTLNAMGEGTRSSLAPWLLSPLRARTSVLRQLACSGALMGGLIVAS